MKALKILVVEDRDRNIEAAILMLSGHDLTIVTGYDQAHEVLMQKRIDWSAVTEAIKGSLPRFWTVELHESLPVFTDISGDKIKNCLYRGRHMYYLPDELSKKFDEIVEKFSSPPYDVVLTDVMVPKGGYEQMSAEGRALVDRQGEMPYGPVIALRALQAGVKRVGILTSGSHHADPFVFAFDFLDGFTIGDVRVVCSNRMDVWVDSYYSPCEWNQGKMNSGEIFSVKNWKMLLEKVL